VGGGGGSAAWERGSGGGWRCTSIVSIVGVGDRAQHGVFVFIFLNWEQQLSVSLRVSQGALPSAPAAPGGDEILRWGWELLFYINVCIILRLEDGISWDLDLRSREMRS
jgi:hypothetical protein